MPKVPDLEYRRRLFLLFEKYDPNRLSSILSIISKAEGKELPFLNAMVKKYGPEPLFTPFSDTDKENLRAKLKVYYNLHDPQKLAGIEAIIPKYLGAEHELFAQLSKKYEAPLPSNPPAPASPSADTQPKQETNHSALRERLTRFYQHYDPAKIATIEQLIKKYGHQPTKIMPALVAKYGPEPTEVVATTVKPLPSSEDTADEPPSFTGPKIESAEPDQHTLPEPSTQPEPEIQETAPEDATDEPPQQPQGLPVDRSTGEEEEALKAQPVDAASSHVLAQPPLPVVTLTLPLLASAAFEYFEDSSEALELIVQLFPMLEEGDSVSAMSFIREQLGHEFVSFLRGFSSTLSMSTLTDDIGWTSELGDRLRSVFEQFEPKLVPLGQLLARCCRGRADDLVVAVHTRYAVQLGEKQRREAVALQFTRRIADYISYHCPIHISLTNFLAERFKNHKEELMRSLRQLYGQEPTIVNTTPLRLKGKTEATRRTTEQLFAHSVDHVRLYRYLSQYDVLSNPAILAALGMSPGQWTNRLLRVTIAALQDLFCSARNCIECLQYACGPEIPEGGDSYLDPSVKDISMLGECLERNKIPANPVFLIINSQLVGDVLDYFIELCDDAFAQKPVSSEGMKEIVRFLKANPELIPDGLSNQLEEAAGVIYISHGSDERACLASLANRFGPLTPLMATSAADSKSLLAEAKGGAQLTKALATIADNHGLRGLEIGGRHGITRPLQHLLVALSEEEETIRRTIAFNEYTDSSNVFSAWRTMLLTIKSSRTVEEGVRKWALPRSTSNSNPLA